MKVGMRLVSPLLVCLAGLPFHTLVYGYPDVIEDLRSRQTLNDPILNEYDYIIVGGGQSGLVIASRLSEDSRKSVLVVEYGDFETDPAQLDPPSSNIVFPRNLYNYTVLPQRGLNNRRAFSFAAAVVGGGSTINGMVFDRGSARDYDDWERFGNPGWGFSDLLPYFKKARSGFDLSGHFGDADIPQSATLNPPRPEVAAEHGITWDIPSAYGNGPIQATFPEWQWPGLKVQWQVWKEMGIPIQKEGAGGKAYGAFWAPSANNRTYHRSYVVGNYYKPDAAHGKRNLRLITRHRVNEVLFDRKKRATGVTIQLREGGATFTVRAKKEIVLTAGWLHTPQILQRSGIGPKALLQEAGIPVLVDLPGVGSNLQDHPTGNSTWEYRNDAVPNVSSLVSNETFIAWADELWKERKGPRSYGFGNTMVQVPLSLLSPQKWRQIVDEFKTQNGTEFLPSNYTPEQLRGWRRQRDILAASYSSSQSSVTEVLFRGAATSHLVLQRQSSRGTVQLNTTSKYSEPIVDYYTNVNPVDRRIAVEMIRFYRRFMSWPSHQIRDPVEIAPGAAVTADEDISNYLANRMISSIGHSCCTAAMGPRDLGGVLTPQLLVHGVSGLSVGDISSFPMIPATHTCATVYAVAEKAADLIKRRT